MPITNLAPELLRQCLGHLDRTGLEKTSLVCRDWLAPSRDHYWGSLSVTIEEESAILLAPVLGEGTTVPHRIGGLTIDESEDLEYRKEEDVPIWQASVSKIMRHFSTASMLSVICLDLSQFSAEARSLMLRPNQAHKSLVVRWLKVAHAQDVTSFILNQPSIVFLGIGTIKLAEDEKGKNMDDGDGDKGKVTEEDEDENDSAANLVLPSPDPIVRLDKLRHLCLFSPVQGVVWSHLVPALAKGPLPELKTLIANCHDREEFVKLLAAAAPTLRSVAVSFENPGITIDLTEARSLTNLSIYLASYPDKEHVLSDTVSTVSSAPPSVEHVFLNVGPETIKPGKQPDSGPAQWAALDAALAALPQLRRVTVTVAFQPCLIMFIGGNGERILETWKKEALDYVRAGLQGCDANGLVEVKDVYSAWTSKAFADYDDFIE